MEDREQLMVCPNCGLKLRRASDCPECGVNINAFLDELRQEALAFDEPDAVRQSESRKEPEFTGPAMVCPGCGLKQAKAPDCVRCGIVIERFLRELKEDLLADAEDESDAEDKTEQKGDTSLKKKTLTFFEEAGIDQKKYTSSFFRWMKRSAFLMAQTAVFWGVVWLLCAGLFYSSGILWRLYVETHIGQTYLVHFRAGAEAIFELVGKNPLVLALELTLITLAIGLVIGAVSRLCFIMTLFYTGRGFFWRMAVWGAITVFFSTYAAVTFLGMQWRFGFVLSVFPALCLFGICFRLTRHLLPELDLATFLEKFALFVKSERLRGAFARMFEKE